MESDPRCAAHSFRHCSGVAVTELQKLKNQNFPRRLGFALNGLQHMARNERSFRVHLLATGFVILFCVLARPPLVWCSLLLFLCGWVLALEAVNSALELLADALHPGFSEAVGLAKDCLAGAVLLSAVVSVLVFGFCVWSVFG